MFPKSFVILFIACTFHATSAGSITMMMKQPAAIKDLLISIQTQRDTFDNTFDLTILRLKHDIGTAKVHGKYELKKLQAYLKPVDPLCSATSKLALKDMEKSLNTMKICEYKDHFKMARKEVDNQLKMMEHQAITLYNYCRVMAGANEDVDTCVSNGVERIEGHVQTITERITAGVEEDMDKGHACVEDTYNTIKNVAKEVRDSVEECLNPSTAAPEESDEDDSSTENGNGSDESDESSKGNYDEVVSESASENGSDTTNDDEESSNGNGGDTSESSGGDDATAQNSDDTTEEDASQGSDDSGSNGSDSSVGNGDDTTEDNNNGDTSESSGDSHGDDSTAESSDVASSQASDDSDVTLINVGDDTSEASDSESDSSSDSSNGNDQDGSDDNGNGSDSPADSSDDSHSNDTTEESSNNDSASDSSSNVSDSNNGDDSSSSSNNSDNGSESPQDTQEGDKFGNGNDGGDDVFNKPFFK